MAAPAADVAPEDHRRQNRQPEEDEPRIDHAVSKEFDAFRRLDRAQRFAGPYPMGDMKDGTVVIFDGEEAYVSPASADPPGARFHVLTWPWFIVSPYKLRGEAINLSELGHRPLDGRQHRTCKMTFDPGTGDAPDDWYVLYRDLDNKRLVAQAYIVSFGKTKAEANKEPHAVWYQDYRDVNGMGRAVESNFHTAFTVDCLKVALVKDEMVARSIGVELFDPIFRFDADEEEGLK